MPKQNIKELYKVGNSKLKKYYRINIYENTKSIGFEIDTIELLDFKDLEHIQREKYKILHIEAIQVAAKPLTRLSLDKPICICLRYARQPISRFPLRTDANKHIFWTGVFCNDLKNNPNIFYNKFKV